MAEQPQGITAITVGGYKSIRDETTIEIRPLTILAGANSSGKSSIMQPLLMMKQTLDATHDPGTLRLDGPHVRFTQFEQILSKTKSKKPKRLVAGFEYGNDHRLTCEFEFVENPQSEKRKIRVTRMPIDFPEIRNKVISPAMSEDDILELVPDEFRKSFLEANQSEDNEHEFGLEVRAFRCLLGIGIYEKNSEYRLPSVLPIIPTYVLQRQIEQTIHVPGLRGNPEREYKVTFTDGPNFPGPFQLYTAGLVTRWKEEDSSRIDWVEKGLFQLGLTKWIETNSLDAVRVEINVGRLPATTSGRYKEDGVNIADVGFGVSQVLPVLVALASAESGQLVFIEQPELHLHPKAQIALARVLEDSVVNRGVNVVVETHSSLILQGIMTLIAEGGLSNEIVKLHWFERNEEGNTIVKSKDFHENGTHDGDWPVDFSDIRLEEQKRYLDAVTKRRMGLVNEPS